MNKDMEVDLIYYELKLQSLLERFLENGYHIKNDVYFNRLVSFLGGKENKELAEILLKLPLMSEWVLRAVKLWKDSSQIPDHSISAFTLQLLSLISKNEITFVDLSKYDIYNQVINILRVRNADALPTIKLGFIKLMTSLVAHPSGREWLLQTTYWRDILAMSLQSQTVYITKEGHLFIASFLEAMLNHNVSFCSSVWQIIITPLLTKPDERLRNHDNLIEACDEKIEKFLGPTVRLVNDVLEYFFEKCLDLKTVTPNIKVFKDILMMPKMIESATNYLYIVRNQNFLYEIGRIWIMSLFYSMAVEVKDGVIKPDIDKEFMEPIVSLFSIMTEGFKTACTAKYLYFISIHWYKLKAKIKVEYCIESDESYTFENQFVIPQLIPSFLFCRAACKNIMEGDDVRDEYVSKVYIKLSKTSIRWGYKFRDALLPVDVLFELGPKAISYILQLKPYMSRECAVMVFQSFLYSLVDMNAMLKRNNHYIPMFARCECYLKTLLEGLTEVIVYFNISWKDSIESLCVFLASVEFLKIPTWSPMLVIADLNLIKVGISRYLSPDLALLIDRQDNCATVVLGSLLRQKLHDSEWSVRDSALEVVLVIADVSNIEFQSFQKVILDNDLCNLILSVSLLDGESFVRASALKCLNRLVPNDVYWKNHLENQEIIQKMMIILKCETEGVVRAQAAAVLCTISKYHDLNPFIRKEIYDSMSSAALDDLYWEVRLSSLNFWSDKVDEKLGDQGMVDGEFPKCTFSPESRKIVNLTETEIKKRLHRVLDELSEIGCLTVLKHAISDDCDLQVSKKGLEISKKLVDLIEKHKIADNINFEEMGPPSNDSCYFSTIASTPSPSRQSSDDIIEQILGASDTSLLKDVYNPGKDTHTTSIIARSGIPRHVVTRSEFLRLSQQNFKSLVDEREKWIHSLDSLSSLLNDMLESYEDSDSNAMDCY